MLYTIINPYNKNLLWNVGAKFRDIDIDIFYREKIIVVRFENIKYIPAYNFFEKYKDKADAFITVSSGNFSIALAKLLNEYGKKLYVIPTNQNINGIIEDILNKYNAKMIKNIDWSTIESRKDLYRLAYSLAKENGWFVIDQHHDWTNVEAHIKYTGPLLEKLLDLSEGDIIVTSYGTGGHSTGLALYLKNKYNTRHIVIFPDEPVPAITTYETKNEYFFRPELYEIMEFPWSTIKDKYHIEGRLLDVGMSGYLVVKAAEEISKETDKKVIAIVADNYEKYKRKKKEGLVCESCS